jgi:hypothetical protein
MMFISILYPLSRGVAQLRCGGVCYYFYFNKKSIVKIFDNKIIVILGVPASPSGYSFQASLSTAIPNASLRLHFFRLLCFFFGK